MFIWVQLGWSCLETESLERCIETNQTNEQTNMKLEVEFNSCGHETTVVWRRKPWNSHSFVIY